MTQAIYNKQTINGKKSRAETQVYMKRSQFIPTHPIHCGYMDGTPITENHLIAVRVYCELDTLQKKFSETYRILKNDDTFKDIIGRHSNYHHFGKYLKESVEVFGIKYQNGIIQRMYHGIDKELIFNSLKARIYSPFSTTYDRNVAVQFSHSTGLVLELVPHGNLKYFSCEWISPFPYECELLFIGGTTYMNIVNIYRAGIDDNHKTFTIDYNSYIASLRIISDMISSNYHLKNPADIHQIVQFQKTNGKSHIHTSGLTMFDKKLCLALIYHELHRNEYQDDQFSQIGELPDLNKYIDELLHNMCLKKGRLWINMESMNKGEMSACDPDDYGDIGYSFMKFLFCTKKYEGINLKVFNALFPNLINVDLLFLSSIDSKFLDDILDILQNSKTRICTIRLTIANQFGSANISKQRKMYETKFKSINFEMSVDESDIRPKAKRLSIHNALKFSNVFSL